MAKALPGVVVMAWGVGGAIVAATPAASPAGTSNGVVPYVRPWIFSAIMWPIGSKMLQEIY